MAKIPNLYFRKPNGRVVKLAEVKTELSMTDKVELILSVEFSDMFKKHLHYAKHSKKLKQRLKHANYLKGIRDALLWEDNNND